MRTFLIYVEVLSLVAGLACCLMLRWDIAAVLLIGAVYANQAAESAE